MYQTSDSKSGSAGRTNHLNPAHNPNGTKHTYMTIVVAAMETK